MTAGGILTSGSPAACRQPVPRALQALHGEPSSGLPHGRGDAAADGGAGCSDALVPYQHSSGRWRPLLLLAPRACWPPALQAPKCLQDRLESANRPPPLAPNKEREAGKLRATGCVSELL